MRVTNSAVLTVILASFLLAAATGCGGGSRGGRPEPDSARLQDAPTREVGTAADTAADSGGGDARIPDDLQAADAEPVDVVVDSGSGDLDEDLEGAMDPTDAQADAAVAPEISPPGPGEPWKFLVILTSPIVGIHFDEFGDSVSAWCLPLDGAGHPLPDPGDVVVITDAPDAIIDGGEYAFPQRGEYVISCQSESLGIAGDTTVSVTTGALNDQFFAAAGRVGALHLHMGHLLKALLDEDSPTVAATGQQLQELAGECLPHGLEELSLLVPLPSGWPAAEELTAMGAVAGPDDEKFGVLLDDLTLQFAAVTVATENLGVDFTEGKALLLEQEVDNLAVLAEEYSLLQPSELAVLANRDKLAALMGPAADSLTRQTALTLAAAADSSRWTLTEIMVTVAIKGIMAKLPSVEWVLIQSAKTMTQMIMMMELFEALSEQGGSGFAPVVYTIYGPGAMSVNPGLKWKIDGGGFSFTPEHNMVIFIPPEVFKAAAELIWDIVTLFTSLWSLYDFQWGNYLDWPDYEQFFELAGLAVDFGFNLNSVVNGLHPGGCIGDYNLYPYDVTGDADAQLVWFDEFPTQVNCSFVPQNGILIPVNLYGGIGEAVQVMTGKEPPGACTCE